MFGAVSLAKARHSLNTCPFYCGETSSLPQGFIANLCNPPDLVLYSLTHSVFCECHRKRYWRALKKYSSSAIH